MHVSVESIVDNALPDLESAYGAFVRLAGDRVQGDTRQTFRAICTGQAIAISAQDEGLTPESLCNGVRQLLDAPERVVEILMQVEEWMVKGVEAACDDVVQVIDNRHWQQGAGQ